MEEMKDRNEYLGAEPAMNLRLEKSVKKVGYTKVSIKDGVALLSRNGTCGSSFLSIQTTTGI